MFKKTLIAMSLAAVTGSAMADVSVSVLISFWCIIDSFSRLTEKRRVKNG
jgi:hypothetical protein